MSNYKALLLSDGALKTFNSKNEWVNVGNQDTLTGELIMSSGFSYDIIKQSFNTKYTKLTQTDTLDDGSIVYTSGELTKDMGITAMTETTIDDEPYIELTVPTFTPKDSILSTDKLMLYAEGANTQMEIEKVDFSTTQTHDSSITFDVTFRYYYDKKIKMAFKVNNGEYGAYSDLVSPSNTNVISGIILSNMLTIGTNNITIKLANEDESVTLEYPVETAITMKNEAPYLLFITADSNEFKCHFKIIDEDADQISYKATLSNSAHTDYVIQDWTDYTDGPIEETIYFDTAIVEIGATNTLKVTYRDSKSPENEISSTYVFEGKYKNLMFVDESGEYYSTDKGVLLKYLDFHKLVAGTVSDVKTVTLKNSNTYNINSLNLKLIIDKAATGVTVYLSKNKTPFVGVNQLDYGDEIIKAGETKDFYIRVDTDISAINVCNFSIEATAMYDTSTETEEPTTGASEITGYAELEVDATE